MAIFNSYVSLPEGNGISWDLNGYFMRFNGDLVRLHGDIMGHTGKYITRYYKAFEVAPPWFDSLVDSVSNWNLGGHQFVPEILWQQGGNSSQQMWLMEVVCKRNGGCWCFDCLDVHPKLIHRLIRHICHMYNCKKMMCIYIYIYI